MNFLVFAVVAIVAFFSGVWLAPTVRGDYQKFLEFTKFAEGDVSKFKKYVEQKLAEAEQRAKDRFRRII